MISVSSVHLTYLAAWKSTSRNENNFTSANIIAHNFNNTSAGNIWEFDNIIYRFIRIYKGFNFGGYPI